MKRLCILFMALFGGFLFLSNLSVDSIASELRKATFVVG